jgi:hypothetical protein
MGKYAMYRRRGGSQETTPPLDPPPQPLLSNIGGTLVLTSYATGNTGGTQRFYSSEDEGDTWELWDTATWQVSTTWGLASVWTGKWVKITDGGNGVQWAAVNTPSNILEL